VWPVSTAFAEGLQTSHQMLARVTVTKGGVRLLSDVDVVSGSISVDASQVFRRSCTLQVAPRIRVGEYDDRPALPDSPGAPFGHYGQQLEIERGLVYPNGVTEWIPAGVFRIEGSDGSLLSDGTVTVTGRSREIFVVEDTFKAPRTWGGPSAQAIIATLIRETLPSAQVLPLATRDARVPQTTFEDRWSAIQTLAAGIGAVVFTDPLGRFIIKDAPLPTSGPDWRVADSTLIVTAGTASSRDGVCNEVTASAESATSGEVPVSATVRDTGVTSPTRWGDPDTGAFGKVPKVISIPSLATSSQAHAAAAAELSRLVGSAASIDLSTVPNVAAEALDVWDVTIGGSVQRYVIDSFEMDLLAGGAFPVQAREIGSAVLS
jgi:hypothetical protein